jgi:N-sulfoglucosamine sulfohydrolase
MSRISSLLTAALVAIFVVAVQRAEAIEPQRPNILWISLEDISPDLGCYGDAYAVTPHMDRLAAQGARFTRAFAHAGVCAPSRSGIITGMYPTSIGTQHMRSQGVPPVGVKCFTEYLRSVGYYCTNDSKTDYNFPAPTTAWDENRPGAHWRNRPAADHPFFAVINLTTTHESQIRLAPDQQEKRRESLAPAERHDPAQAKVPPYYPDTPVTRLDWARYYDNLTFTDKRVGQILAELEADGLAESTIVFCWGDHGRGLPRAKRWLYDSGLHVPLIVRWPGQIEPGSVRNELVALLDLAPTMLSLAGVPIPGHLQGQAFLGAARAEKPREYIYGARDRMDETYDLIRAVRDSRFKYLRNYRPELPYSQRIAYMDEMPTMQEWRRLHAAGRLSGPPLLFFAERKPDEELYDLDADPHEIHNLANDPAHAATLARLRAAHEKWASETGDLGLVPESELQQRMRPEGRWAHAEAPQVTWVKRQATLTCATPGSSIAFRITGDKPANSTARSADANDSSPSPKENKQARKNQPVKRVNANRKGAADIVWKLYSAPVEVPPGHRLETKACRLGYRESEIASFASPPE